jgi:hypothetical protein
MVSDHSVLSECVARRDRIHDVTRDIGIKVSVLALTILVTPSYSMPKLLDNASAYKVLSSERKMHIGERVTFDGTFVTDYIEHSLIIPIHCRWGIGVGSTSSDFDKALNQLIRSGLDPSKGLRGTFTGTIVQNKKGSMKFSHDDGVRLNVTELNHARVVRSPVN